MFRLIVNGLSTSKIQTQLINRFYNNLCTQTSSPSNKYHLNSVFVYHSISFSSTTMSAKRALVVIANGSEEMESVTPIDVLRRAGVDVTVAGLIDENMVVCSRQVRVVPEVSFAQAVSNQDFDAIILPGGLGGAEAFSKSKELGEVLKKQEDSGRIVAAICAAPTALKEHGIGIGKAITSYPSTKDIMVEGSRYIYKDDRVVVDGNLITSQGPGTAIEFSLALVENLVSKDKADEVAKGMLVAR